MWLIASLNLISQPFQQSIDVINSSNMSADVEIGVAEHTKASVRLEKLPQSIDDDYFVIALPENFMVHRKKQHSSSDFAGHHVFNNKGQVAGYLYDKNKMPVRSNRNNAQLNQPLFNGKAAIWDPKDGLILSGLHNSRAIAIDDNGNVAISQNQHPGFESHPNIFWNLTNRQFDFDPKYVVQNGKEICPNPSLNYEYRYMSKDIQSKLRSWLLLDTSDLSVHTKILVSKCLDENNVELFLYSKYGFSLISFDYEFDVNKSSFRTASPMVHARLNDRGEAVALLRGDDRKYLLGKWIYAGKTIISNSLNQNPAFRGYKSFDILGFNSSGEVLIMADTAESMHSLNYEPVSSRLFMLIPIPNQSKN